MKEVKVLGPGCAKCKKLAENVKEAIAQSGKDLEFEYVTDIQKIMLYGMIMTPGLVLDGKVVSAGKVLNVKEILKMIEA